MKGVKYVVLRLLVTLVAYCFIPFGSLASFSALAETIPVQQITQYCINGGSCAASIEASCALYNATPYTYVLVNTRCDRFYNGSFFGSTFPSPSTGPGCPSSYTLVSGACYRPDCSPGQTRDANGQCQDPPECNGVSGNAWIPVGTDNNGDGRLSDDEYTTPTYETVVISGGNSVQGLPYNHGNCRGYFNTPTQTTQCKKSSANNKFYCYVQGTTKGVAVQAEEATQGSTGCTAPKIYFTVGNQAYCQDPVTELNPSIPQNDPSCSSLNQATYNGKTICLKQTQKPNVEKTNTESKQRVINADGSVTETTTKRYENGSETVETKRWSTSNNGQVSGDPDTVETTTKEGPNGEKSPDEKDGGLSFDDPYVNEQGQSTEGQIQTTNINLNATSNQFNTASSCPADRSLHLTLAGISIPVSYQPICYAASTYIKPIVLLFASYQAILIFLGGLKND